MVRGCVAASRVPCGTRRCHTSGRQNRCRPRAGAWYGSDGVSAVRPPAGRSESDQWQESGEAGSRLDACDFPATARVVLPGGPVADYPVAHINARLESSPWSYQLGQPLGTMTAAIDTRASTMAQLRYTDLIRFLTRVLSLVRAK